MAHPDHASWSVWCRIGLYLPGQAPRCLASVTRALTALSPGEARATAEALTAALADLAVHTRLGPPQALHGTVDARGGVVLSGAAGGTVNLSPDVAEGHEFAAVVTSAIALAAALRAAQDENARLRREHDVLHQQASTRVRTVHRDATHEITHVVDEPAPSVVGLER